jgi:uncharacterized protein (TIGR00288 family)
MKKIAIFVDWENLRMDIASIQRNNPQFRDFDYNNPTHLSKLFSGFIEEDEEIYRIFFYTAPPKTSNEILKSLKDISQKSSYNSYLSQVNNGITNRDKFQKVLAKSKKLISDIEKEPYIAVRLGELKINGVQNNGKPIINQKQVDMLLGLDISHVSYLKLVDNILIFCKDSDMTPALKVARINGIKTVVAHIEGGFKITNSLIKHSDIIRKKSPLDILALLTS